MNSLWNLIWTIMAICSDKHRTHYHSILPWLTGPDDTGWDTSTFQTGIPPHSPAWASLRFTEAFSSSHFQCPIEPSPQKGPICPARKFRFLESARCAQFGCGGVCLPDASRHLFSDLLLKEQGSFSEDSIASRVRHLIYCLHDNDMNLDPAFHFMWLVFPWPEPLGGDCWFYSLCPAQSLIPCFPWVF